MTAYVFTLRLSETGQLAGQAVLCAEARYASVWWLGTARPDRRLAKPGQWLAVDRQLADNLPAGPIGRTSPIGVLLATGQTSELKIQYLYQDPLDDGTRATNLAAELDQRLRQVQV